MNYFSQLNEDEMRYICSVIPLQDSVYYFKRYPKDFAKVLPGFRATSIKSQDQAGALLLRCHNQAFILSFIEKHITRWIEEIQGEIARRMDDGDSNESALLHTLPNCFFVDNIGLFFKLINKEYSEEYLALLRAAVKAIKEADGKQEKFDNEIKCKESEIKKLLAHVEHIQADLVRTRLKLDERSAEIKYLKRTNADLENLKALIQRNEEAMATCKSKMQEHEDTIRQLKIELAGAKENRKQLEVQIKVELEKQQHTKDTIIKATKKAKCPIDIDEFKDYLGYNFVNIGVQDNSEYFSLLKEYLCRILFVGIPIVVNMRVWDA